MENEISYFCVDCGFVEVSEDGEMCEFCQDERAEIESDQQDF